MNARQLFLEYAELDEVYQAGNSEAFADEEECKNYANHFNISMRKVLREEVRDLPERKTEVKVKKAKKADATKLEEEKPEVAEQKEEPEATEQEEEEPEVQPTE